MSTDSMPSVGNYKTPTFAPTNHKSARKAITFDGTTSSKKRRCGGKGVAIDSGGENPSKNSSKSKKSPDSTKEKITPNSTKKKLTLDSATKKKTPNSSTKGKEVIELSSDSSSSFNIKEYLERQHHNRDSVDSEDWNLFGPAKSPSYEDRERVEAINDPQEQFVRDMNDADKILPKLGSKKTGDKLRFIYITMRSNNSADPGHRCVILGSLRFWIVYEKYSARQNYKPEEFELWYEGMLLCPEVTPDEVGLPDEVTVVVHPKRKGMNLDSRFKILVLNKTVNESTGIRLTFMSNDRLSAVYDRISGLTGATLGTFLIGCHGQALPDTGNLDEFEPKIRNEDSLFLVAYPAGFVLPFSK